VAISRPFIPGYGDPPEDKRNDNVVPHVFSAADPTFDKIKNTTVN